MSTFYAYDLSDDLISQLTLYNFSGDIDKEISSDTGVDSDDPTSLTPSSNPPSKSTLQDGQFNCTYCGLINADSPSSSRQHYKKDFHKLNIKRKIQDLPPLTEDEFEKQIGELDESLSGSDESSSDDDNKINKLIEKTELSSIDEEEEDSSKSPSQGSPYAFYQLIENSTYSSKLLTTENTLAIYKNLLDFNILEESPTKALSNLQTKSASFSIILMIGGGHFSGAVISHQRSKKKGLLPNSLDSIEIITHKSFHRYTTRRKQGGSQSASDNARGKANSAGSSLRRYNEQALEQEIHELLDSWKQYIDNCDSIYIRASGRSNRGILMNYPKSPIVSSDKRIKSLPFTTGRATASEVKRSWFELTKIKLVNKSSLIDNLPKKKITKEEIRKQLEKSRNTQRSSSPKEQPLSVDEKHTIELISIIKKSRSPRLIAYIKSNNLSPDFQLEPSSQYFNTPNLLCYASSVGSHHIVTTLLSLNADPTVKNAFGRTAFEIASDVSTTDSFQLARATLGEDKFDWIKAKVGPPLTKKDISNRIEKEKADNEEKIRSDLENLEKEQAQKRLDKTIYKHGAGKTLSSNVITSISQEGSLRGLSEEAKMKLERERRARAAEARFKK